MKKKLVLMLSTVFLLSSVGTVLAATPFDDVPAKHWSYDAVSQLAHEGVIVGYADDTFKGDKVVSRYEMAVVVARALTKVNQATSGQKELIEKLATEYTAELNQLNVRVTTLEKKVNSAIAITGEVRERYESTSGQGSNLYQRVQVNLFAPLTDDLIFGGRLEANNTWGVGPADNGVPSSPTVPGSQQIFSVSQAFIAGKALGFNNFALGSLPMRLGEGLLVDSETSGSNSGGNVSVILGGQSKVMKWFIGGGKLGVSDIMPNNSASGPAMSTLNASDFNIVWQANKDLELTLTGDQDREGALYRDLAVGFKYSGLRNVVMTGEYGTNASSNAKSANNADAAKAWYYKAKYRGANGLIDNSYGFWVTYRDADPQFDPWTLGSAGGDDVTSLLKAGTSWNAPNSMGALSNVKGFGVGFEQTVFKNAIAKLQYNDLKSKVGNIHNRNFMASLTYSF